MDSRDLQASFVVTLYNGASHLPWFWQSLEQVLGESREAIIVNDGSADDVLARMPGCTSHPRVTIIEHDYPKGVSVAANAALRRTRGRLIFMINSDVIFTESCIQALGQATSNQEKAGLVSAVLLYPQSRCVQHAGIAFSSTNSCHIFRHLPGDHPLISQRREVQGIASAFCCLRRETLDEVGYLNEGYYNSYEDFDFGFRIRDRGFQILVEPTAVAYHWERQSGFIRGVLRKPNVARLWRDWGRAIIPDLHLYLRQSWEYLIDSGFQPAPSYTVVNLAKGSMAQDVLDILFSGEIPISISRTWQYPQRGTVNRALWLPQIMPVSAAQHPEPFLYIVDSFRDLDENAYWRMLRRSRVQNELTFDLGGNVLKFAEPPN